MDNTLLPKPHNIVRNLLIILIVLLFIAAVSLLYVIRKDDEAAKKAEITHAATTLPAAEYSKRIDNPDVTYKLEIKDNKVISGPTKIVVQKGQSVNVDFTTPGGEINVELVGYNIITETNSVQDASGGFHFIADERGTFKFFIPGAESDNSVATNEPEHDIQLGTIEVR